MRHLWTLAVEGAGADQQSSSGTDLLDLLRRFLAEQGLSLLLNILAAAAIFLIGRWVARLITRLVEKLLGRANVDLMLSKFLGNIVYAGLIVLVVIAALERLGVNTTSFAAVLAAAGLAIGLALQGSLGNFAAGVMIILFKPFQVGDFVEAAGQAGIVEEIHIFNTIMRSGDNKKIVIPNGGITSDNIVNFSAKPTRRIDMVVGCGYDDDIRAVKQYLEELVKSDDRILTDPAPVVAVNELSESSINFIVRPWVNSSDYWDVRWRLNERIKIDFDERGFSIPYPQQDVHMHTVSS